MNLKICAIMDPLETLHNERDSTLAILQEAQRRHFENYYLQPKDIFLSDNKIYGLCSKLSIKDHQIVSLDIPSKKIVLNDFDIVFMRKDPPFDLPFLYTTYLLEIAQDLGCFIVNNPRSIRDANEKLFAAWFPQCCPQTLVTSHQILIRQFLKDHQKIIVKRLNSMGGDAVFVLEKLDPNINVIIEILTYKGSHPIMAQRFLPEINKGDKRILMIAGKPYPYAISRIPAKGDFRGNLSSGATPIGCELSDRDHWICKQLGPTLIEKGLFLVGLDVIGDFLTEINVTSPTGVREIESAFGVNLCAEILDSLIKEIGLRSGNT